jgi:hypothetical protein
MTSFFLPYLVRRTLDCSFLALFAVDLGVSKVAFNLGVPFVYTAEIIQYTSHCPERKRGCSLPNLTPLSYVCLQSAIQLGQLPDDVPFASRLQTSLKS